MKPVMFEYVRAHTAGEAVDALRDGGTRVLAGGQSLLLEMNYRTARPARLVDINRVGDFAGMSLVDTAQQDTVLRVRPLVRHREFEQPSATAEPPVPGPLGRLLARVARHIAHPPIRARGTMLGSLAYAHPAAEWPAVAAALDAQLDLTGPGGVRTVPASEFVTGPFATLRRPDELLTEVRLPLLPPDAGVGFVEHRRTRASFADLAALAAVTVRDGLITFVRVGLVNAADRPVRARSAEDALTGAPPAAVPDAARVAALRDTAPGGHPYGDAEYRRHAVAVLVRRALEQAVSGARDAENRR